MKFVSKPVTIEAVQYTGSNANEIRNFAGLKASLVMTPSVVLIHTEEGTMKAQPSDWIIKGTIGEFYPCKHNVFVKKYEPVAELEPTEWR